MLSINIKGPEFHTFHVRNRGYMLSVFVNIVPAEPSNTEVRYELRTLWQELPAPAVAKKIEYDDGSSLLRCWVPEKIDVVEKFYLQAMPDLGYKPLQHDAPQKDCRVLRFETEEKGVLLVSLNSDEARALFVEVRYYSPDEFDEMPPVELGEEEEEVAEIVEEGN